MSRWQLEVLGAGRLYREAQDGEPWEREAQAFTPERKMAALLAYLALEGATARSRLAGLLWPEVAERTARNNLAALLHRLKKLTGTSLLTGSDVLGVTGSLEVDAARLKVAELTGERDWMIAAFAPLLESYDYDDLPEFGEWLLAERERLARLYRQALEAEAGELEARGDYRGAAEATERLLEHDPVAEEAHRRLMRLLYLQGDRPAALKAYARLKEVLRRELEVDPLPETVTLAEEIAQDAVVPAVKPERAAPAIPLRVLRPPLVGRERAWARLEEAWAKGQVMVISGPPGSGKTRLMTEFAASKGRYVMSEGRPGDDAVPLVSLARAYRRFLTAFELELAPWVRAELARLLPGLAAEKPPPMRSNEDSLRFHEAIFQSLLSVSSRVDAVLTDDLQFYDASSLDALGRATDRQVAEGLDGIGLDGQELHGRARTLIGFRSGEMSADYLAALEASVAGGLAVHLELEPLEPAAVTQMLRGFGLPMLGEERLEPLSATLHRYTGGNPLFIVETVKSLLESERLSGRLPERLDASLPRPWGAGGKVTSLIAQRLERLSTPAQRLVWTAAVAQTDFDLGLAGAVLQSDPLDLAAPYGELERAQIFAGGWFSHDLLYETALKSMPAPIRTLLHRRCAAYLQSQEENPARIARHYLEAGDHREAAPFLLEAAAAAKAAFQLGEAAQWYEQTAAILEARGEAAGTFEARFEQAALMIRHGMKGDKASIVAGLASLAETPLQKAKAYYAEVALLNAQGQGVESERAARQGYEHALNAGDPAVQARLLSGLGEALYLQGRIAEASDVLKPLCDLWEGLGRDDELAAALSDLAMTLDLQDRYEEAAGYYRRADALAAKLGDKAKRAITLNNFGYSLRNAGVARRSTEPLHQAKELLEEISGDAETRRRNLGQLGESHAQLADFALALEYLEGAIALSQEHDLPHGFLHRSLAEVYLSLGRFPWAGAHTGAALRQPGLRDRLRGAIWLTQARLLVFEGEDAREAFARAEALMDLESDKTGLARFRLAQAPTLPPAQALEQGLRLVEMSRAHELGAFVSGARTRCAQALLALGQPGEALRHSALAVELLERYDPVDFYRAEVLLTHARALEAVHDPAALMQLQRCLAWVMEVANVRTPPEHRQSFLENNPVNRAVLAAARLHRLIAP